MKSGPQLYLKCEWCGCFFPHGGGKRKRWCSDKHKQASWRNDRALEQAKLQKTHECVEGFIFGTYNNGICNQCGARQP